ncbi:MAG: hypothetical protein QMC78_02760 [Methanocellales archaeon]|nr:hypothetical protein [Methanocellales archaeon]
METIDDLPKEKLRELYRLSLDIFVTTLESLEEVIGKKAPLGIVRLSSKKLGDHLEATLREKIDGKWTFKKFVEALVVYLNEIGLRGELVKASADEIIIRKHICPLGEAGKRYPNVCVYRVGALAEAAGKALNKAVELQHVKNIIKGDRYCEFVLRLR